jgi:NifU-like protein involved in Fe-S cluster formation
MSFQLDDEGRIQDTGLQVAACAVGQAAAALFANSARGHDVREIAEARGAIAAWLDGAGPSPEWPGIEVLDPARAHSARHGAVMLAWDAALAALSKAKAPG